MLGCLDLETNPCHLTISPIWVCFKLVPRRLVRGSKCKTWSVGPRSTLFPFGWCDVYRLHMYQKPLPRRCVSTRSGAFTSLAYQVCFKGFRICSPWVAAWASPDKHCPSPKVWELSKAGVFQGIPHFPGGCPLLAGRRGRRECGRRRWADASLRSLSGGPGSSGVLLATGGCRQEPGG